MTFIARNKIPLLLLLLGLTLFANTMDAERLFSWDDNRYLEENKLVQGFDVAKIFGEPYFGGYMPITLFSFALEHKLWGLDATGYHVVNVLLHACNGMLVFLLLFHLVGKRSAAVIGSVLFIVHPVQVESVAWISERKNLLSMFFFLLAFMSHIRYRRGDSTKWLGASLLFYLFSILSKPIVVGAPILFMAYDLIWAKVSLRRTIWSAIPAIAIAVFGAVTILITSATVGGIKAYWGGSQWATFQLTMLIAWQYLVGLIDPSTLSIHYHYAPEVIKANWRVWAGSGLSIGLMGLGLRSFWQFVHDREHKPIIFFAVLWAAVFMLPVSNIVPLSIQRADRFLYFPSIMIFLMVGWVWDRLWQHHQAANRRYALVGGIVAVAVLFSGSTYRLNQVWTNSGTLWSHQLKKYPNDDIAINNLAMYYFRTKQYPQAKEVYAELARLTPQNFRAYLFMGLIAFEEERFDASIRFLQQSLPLADESLKESIVVQLLNAYAKAIAQARREERIGDAVEYYHAVIELLPDNRSVYNDLGNAYADIGDMDAAKAAYRQAITVSERYYPSAHANMGLLLLKQGAFDEAQTIFEEIMIREPNALAASGQCKVLNAKGKIDEALDACFLAVALSPDTRDFYDLLVEILLKHHDLENAVLLAGKKLNQSQDALTTVKGFLHARSGQHSVAIAFFEKSGSVLAQLELAQSALAIEAYRLADAVLNKIWENNPELLEAIGLRCITLGRIGDIDNALPLCKAAALREPKNSRYQIAYGDLLTARNSTEEALQFYHQALENGANEVRPKLAAVYYQLGASAEHNGVTGDAIKLYRKAIALNPQAMEHHNSLGRMLLKQRRYREALAAFNTTIRLDATFAQAYANKGQAAYALGENEEALAAYKNALEIDNALPQALEGYCALLKATGGTMDEVCQRAGNL